MKSSVILASEPQGGDAALQPRGQHAPAPLWAQVCVVALLPAVLRVRDLATDPAWSSRPGGHLLVGYLGTQVLSYGK